jgi:hypothetical protein
MLAARTVVSLLLAALLAAAAGLALLYAVTRCPGGTLSVCQVGYSASCGAPVLGGPGECESFMGVEDCYCDKCRFCLGDFQRAYCARARADRLAGCLAKFK